MLFELSAHLGAHALLLSLSMVYRAEWEPRLMVCTHDLLKYSDSVSVAFGEARAELALSNSSRRAESLELPRHILALVLGERLREKGLFGFHGHSSGRAARVGCLIENYHCSCLGIFQ
mmetsp:Transcript_7011/g.18301  ORF Transcript_7011/g.18301 Transcript_7011/m.18301 type:complete len:118 (+) Transcript_7011:352-705(+)